MAYAHIRDAILTGTCEAGTMLSEVSLANEIGLSRTPVRTALALLQDEGWVTLYPKRGALVQGLSERAIAELLDARYVLESTGVQRSSLERRTALREPLEAQIAEQRASLERGDIPAFIESTIAFHRAFVEIGENQVMLELYDRLGDRERYVLFRLGPKLIARHDDIIAEHRELVCELLQEDLSAFRETLRLHMSDTNGRLVHPLPPPDRPR